MPKNTDIYLIYGGSSGGKSGGAFSGGCCIIFMFGEKPVFCGMRIAFGFDVIGICGLATIGVDPGGGCCPGNTGI